MTFFSPRKAKDFSLIGILARFATLFIPAPRLRRKIRTYGRPDYYAICGEIIQRFRQLPDPMKTWKEFCRGLDFESILTVTRSLSITEDRPLRLKDCLTEQEYKLLLENSARLELGRFKISDECWAFGEYLMPVNLFEYSVFIEKHGIDTIDLLKIPTDSVIADVGGYMGESALVFSKHVKNKIYSFEPLAENYEMMLKTIELNDIGDQVIPVNMALGDVPDTEMFSQSGTAGCHRTGHTQRGTAIPSDTFDNFCAKNKLKIGMIKVDIEGAEQLFLAGAKKIINRDRPILLLSIYHPWTDLDIFNVKKIVESWNLGYKFRIFKPMDNNMIAEMLLICEQ